MTKQSEAEKAAEEYVESRERLSACQACNTRSNRVGHEHYKAFLAGAAWSAPKWVRCSERMPEDGKRQLCVVKSTDRKYPLVWGWMGNGWAINVSDPSLGSHKNIIEWVALPAAPEVEK